MRSRFTEHSQRTQFRTQARTQPGTQAQKRRRKRPLPYVFGSSERLHERFWQILDEYAYNERARVYIYKASKDGYAIRPMLKKCRVFPELVDDIRDTFGGGEYAIYIRQGETMLVAGIIGIAKGRRT